MSKRAVMSKRAPAWRTPHRTRIVSQAPPPPDGDPFDPPTSVDLQPFRNRPSARRWLARFASWARCAPSVTLLRVAPDELVYRTPIGWVLITIEPGG